MSSLAAARSVVARARRRLLTASVLEWVAWGALVAALVEIGRQGAAWLLDAAWEPSLRVSLTIVMISVLGAVVRRVPHAAAALALDRAAGTDEAFVSSVSAADADPGFRELSAAYALRGLAGRPLRRLLPWTLPRFAAPTLAAWALVTALAVVGPDDGPVAARESGTTVVAASAGAGDAASGERAPGAGGMGAPVPASRPGASVAPERPIPDDVPALPDADLERLARDLAARGLAAAEEALAALSAGDRATAEALLRAALTTPGGAAGGAPAAAAGGPRDGALGADAPGAWSAGTWPLRYDREVRAWLRRQAATHGGDARTEER